MASSDLKQKISELFGKLNLKDDIEHNDEVTKWVTYAETFPSDSASCFKSLTELNEELITKSVLLGNGLTPSKADFVMFAKLHSFLVGLSKSDRQKLPNLMRWVDWIQNQKGFSGFETIDVEKAPFDPPIWKAVDKADKESNAKGTGQSTVKVTNAVADQSSNKPEPQKKAKEDTKAAPEKKKLPDKEPGEVEKEVSVSLLNIQVGLIRKAWKHPTADSLLVEEIDVGEANVRQVVSGLAKFCSPDELTNRYVVLITNVKPGKLRDVVSQGLVLCASNEDHTIVEPLLPPAGAKVGERVSFSGYDGKPEDLLNPKKKQLEKITPHLFTDVNGVATFKGIPFMTSGGPCRSSIPKASIK